MKIRVLYFAAVRDVVGADEEALELPAGVLTVGAFAAFIVGKRPALEGRMAYVRIAKNEAFADEDEPLADGDVLALIPPVAGG